MILNWEDLGRSRSWSASYQTSHTGDLLCMAPASEYSLTVGAPGYRSSAAQRVELRADETTDLGSFYLTPCPWLPARVDPVPEDWEQWSGRGVTSEGVIDPGIEVRILPEGFFEVRGLHDRAGLELGSPAAFDWGPDVVRTVAQVFPVAPWAAAETRVFQLAPHRFVDVELRGIPLEEAGTTLELRLDSDEWALPKTPLWGGFPLIQPDGRRRYQLRLTPGRYRLEVHRLLHRLAPKWVTVTEEPRQEIELSIDE